MKTFVKTFARLASALGLVAVFTTTTAFAQAPTGTHVKGYTKTTKGGKTVSVRGYNRMAKKPMPKMAHVKGYTKITKSGKTVSVKGYSRKVAPKGTKPMTKTSM